MKQFEVGKSYSARSICDHECIWTLTVISRTAQSIIALLDNETEPRRMRINKKFSEWRNAESVLPLGNYSMAPIISAD